MTATRSASSVPAGATTRNGPRTTAITAIATAEEMSASALEMQALMARFNTDTSGRAQRPGRTAGTTRRLVAPVAAPLHKPVDESKFQPFWSADKRMKEEEAPVWPGEPRHT